MSDLPDPPVPAECDLTGFNFMPLDCVRLIQSDLAAIASGDEFRAAVLLWCRSWTSVPAGSLTNDDRVLSHAVGLSMAKWKRVRKQALHRWYEASDGRLYHPVVTEKALDAWSHREKQRERGRKGNAVRWGSPKDRQRIAEGSPPRSLDDRKGQGQGQGQGQGIKERERSLGERPPAAARSRSDSKDQGEGSPMARAHTKALLHRALIPKGEKQVDEWVVLLRDWAGCTSTDQATACFAWIIGKDDSIQYADAARELALRWRKEHQAKPIQETQEAIA